MKYVFFGTPEFAAIVLDRLILAKMPPSAVVCNPDRPVGRKKIVTAPSTKQLVYIIPVPYPGTGQAPAGIHAPERIEVLQPEKLDNDFIKQISNLRPDFAIVAAYAKIIPKNIIELFPKGVIGVHPSLLPKYRGASPIQSAILGGENETGVTLYMLDEKMDHGPILAKSNLKSQISNLNYIELHDELAKLGGELLVETLPKFIVGKVEPRAQNETDATYTKKFTSEDGFVSEADLNAALGGSIERAAEIDRKIRALGAEPGVWIIYASKEQVVSSKGKRVKLLEAKIENGRLVLMKIQEEGGKPKLVSSEALKL